LHEEWADVPTTAPLRINITVCYYFLVVSAGLPAGWSFFLQHELKIFLRFI
jgi:hypothetical protein